jgi:hypothetical protein
MEQSRITRGRPTVWRWIVGTILLIIALVWMVSAATSGRAGSHNQALPKTQIPRGAMVAESVGLETGTAAA